jgi:antitoxin (DNA-binding transcriptional repressor) of toxin-antitoxin stability system
MLIQCTTLFVIGCDAKMHHMLKASVRDLRYKFRQVEDLLRQGEEIQITKRKRVIATLVPADRTQVKRPDFAGRLRRIFGKRVLKVTGADLISRDRERF